MLVSITGRSGSTRAGNGYASSRYGRTPVPRRADSPLAFVRFYSRHGLAGTGISATAAGAIAQAIQTQEGYAPGTLAYTNNNPGNLTYVGQPGATQGAGGFASFASYSAGYQALVNQISLDATRGTDASGNPINTISDLISSWAPASDPRNDTPAYIASVAAQTGYDPNAPLSSLGGQGGPSPIDATDSIDAASSGLDLSDPVTLGIGVAAAALVAWVAFR